MKKHIIALSLLAACGYTSTASAVQFTDYVKPDTFYQQSYLEGTFNLNSGNQDQTSYSGSFAGDYTMRYNTLPFVWNADVEGVVAFNRDGTEGASTDKGYDFLASTSADKYFNNQGLFFGFGSADLGYRRIMGADDSDDPYFKLGLGAGYGRLYDATALAKAVRIADELVKYGIVSKALTDAGLLALAGVIERESEFVSKYGAGEYRKYWIEAMEAELLKQKALKNNTLGALGSIRVTEVLSEVVQQRLHGWSVRAGVGYIASNYDGSDSDPSLDLGFDYGLPIGLQWQLIERARYSTILNSDDTGHLFINKLTLNYEFSDRIDWENTWNLSYLNSAESDRDVISNSLSTSAIYYIANQLDAVLTLGLDKVDDDIDNNGNDDWDKSIRFGIRYRLN